MDEGLVLLNGITLINSRLSSIILSKLVIVLYGGDDDDDADIVYPKCPMDNRIISMDKMDA